MTVQPFLERVADVFDMMRYGERVCGVALMPDYEATIKVGEIFVDFQKVSEAIICFMKRLALRTARQRTFMLQMYDQNCRFF